MAREYARIMTAIWKNQEFRALSEVPQRMYLFLVTQEDISAAGVLALRLRRWSQAAGDSTPERLKQALRVLEAGRFIAIDWDVEELLIRSFIRWDGGFNNPKRRPVIIRAAAEVDSINIRRLLVAEFQRCGIRELPSSPPDGPPPAIADLPDSDVDSLSDSHPKIDRVDLGSDPFPQVNSLSDRQSTNHGVVVTYLTTEDTTTHNPQPVPPTAGAAAPADPATAQTLVAEWLDSRRKRPPAAVIGQASKAIKAMLEEGIDPDDIRAGIQVWADKGLHPAALPSVVNEVMNAGPPAPRPVARRTTDDKRAAIPGLVAEVMGTSALRPDLRSIAGGGQS